jgi:hypothetical protein
MRLACWRDGGRARPTRIAIFRPVSPLPAGRPKHVSVAVDCTFTSHFRLGFEPIVEIATILFATTLEEFVCPLPNLLAKLFSRLSQFLFFASSVLALFYHSSLPHMNAWDACVPSHRLRAKSPSPCNIAP